jgi:broad specificity phosphatase PhoE
LALAHSFHDWILQPRTVEGDEFRERCEQAKIRRIGFLRHGNTLPGETGKDFDRLLSDKGNEQAAEAGSSFGANLLPFYPRLLVSPAPRTLETAKIFLSSAGADDVVQLTPVSCLYDGAMQPEGSAIFRKIGYAPLRNYTDNEDENDRVTMRRLLGKYSSDAAQAIMNVLQDVSVRSDGNATTLWIVAHAIYLPSAALGVAVLAKCNDDESLNMVLSTVTREAEGYLVNLDDAKVEYLERPSSAKTCLRKDM